MLNLILIVLTSLIVLHLLVSTVKMIRGNKDKIYSLAHVFAFAYFLAELFRCKLYLYFTISLAYDDIYYIFKIAYFVILALEIGTKKEDIWNYSFIVSALIMQHGWIHGYDTITLLGLIVCISFEIFELCHHKKNKWRKSANIKPLKSSEKNQLGLERGSL